MRCCKLQAATEAAAATAAEWWSKYANLWTHTHKRQAAARSRNATHRAPAMPCLTLSCTTIHCSVVMQLAFCVASPGPIRLTGRVSCSG